MAKDESPLIKTSLFQSMGMSREGMITLRDLMMEYYTYAIPDDSIKKRIRIFLERNIQDYIIMKTVFKMIEYYRKREHIFHLPIQIAHRQIHAQRRRQLKIDDFDPTPEKLGVYYQCHGCQNFATTKIVPQDYPSYSNYSELSHSRFRVYSNIPSKQVIEEKDQSPSPPTGIGCEDLVVCCDGKHSKTLEHFKTVIASTSNNKNDSCGAGEGEKKKKPKKKDGNQEDDISFLNVAGYNSIDGLPYCERNKRNTVSGRFTLKTIDNATTESVVIMRTRNSKIQVLSHRTKLIPVEEDGGGGVDDDDLNVDVEDLEEDNVPNFLEMMSTGITKENYERMEQYIKQRTGDFIQPKYKENNKRKILNIVLEPLHKLYNCRVPMQEVDMIGLVKNGKTLCVECGMMTDFKNFNMSPYGPVCNTHPLSSLMHHHPAWVAHNHLQNGTSMSQLLQQVRTQDDEFLTQGEMSKYANKRKTLHPSLLLERGKRDCTCIICHRDGVAVFLYYQSDSFLLKREKCCFVCHHNLMRARPSRPLLLTKRDLLDYQTQKGYLLTNTL